MTIPGPPQSWLYKKAANGWDLSFFDFLRQFAKVLRLFVTGLGLDLCELPGFLVGEVRNQSFEFGRRRVSLVGFFQHQMFKFPDCLIVIHIAFLMKVCGDEECDIPNYLLQDDQVDCVGSAQTTQFLDGFN